jgi:hypothetical protein
LDLVHEEDPEPDEDQERQTRRSAARGSRSTARA